MCGFSAVFQSSSQVASRFFLIFLVSFQIFPTFPGVIADCVNSTARQLWTPPLNFIEHGHGDDQVQGRLVHLLLNIGSIEAGGCAGQLNSLITRGLLPLPGFGG